MGYFLTGWRLRAFIASIILAAAGYLAVSLWAGWNEVLAAFIRIGILGTVLILSLSLVNYGLRFVRWQLYLRKLGHTVPGLASARIYLSGFALTTTPGKAGEAFRGILLKRRGISYPATFAAFISERLSDLVAVVLLALLGLAEYPQARGMVIIAVIGVVLFLTVLSNRTMLDRLANISQRKPGPLGDLLTALTRTLKNARRCHTPVLLLLATLISLVAWGAEAVAFYLALGWMNLGISLAFASFTYALSMLAGALSFMPGGLGGAEAVMVSLLMLKGTPAPEAIAATVFIRLTTLWFAVVIGMIALYFSQPEPKEVE